jgi:hypothetical protein
LALTVQSLSLLHTLLPHIRAALLAVLPDRSFSSAASSSSSSSSATTTTTTSQPQAHASNALTELDRVSQELVLHSNEVTQKFVSIVSDVIDLSAQRLRLSGIPSNSSSASTNTTADIINNSNNNTLSSLSPEIAREFFDETLRNVSTLHKVLSSVLPAVQITDIFSRIFGMLSRKVPTLLLADLVMSLPPPPSPVDLRNPAMAAQHAPGPPLPSPGLSTLDRQRICDEVTHFVTSMAKLSFVDANTFAENLEREFRVRLGMTIAAQSFTTMSITTTAAASPGVLQNSPSAQPVDDNLQHATIVTEQNLESHSDNPVSVDSPSIVSDNSSLIADHVSPADEESEIASV